MTYTGNEDHHISLRDAADLTARYRNQTSTGQIKGGYFGKTAIKDILDQPGCVGIRYYYGLDENNKQVLVVVGVTSDGNDMTGGNLAEISFPCPSYCSEDNDLNS